MKIKHNILILFSFHSFESVYFYGLCALASSFPSISQSHWPTKTNIESRSNRIKGTKKKYDFFFHHRRRRRCCCCCCCRRNCCCCLHSFFFWICFFFFLDMCILCFARKTLFFFLSSFLFFHFNRRCFRLVAQLSISLCTSFEHCFLSVEFT